MPVPYAGSYRKLKAVAKKGVWLGEDAVCPKCGHRGELKFLGTWVDRKMIWLKGDRGVYEAGKIPLSRCGACKGRFRVLPEGVLPYKPNSLALIERCIKAYVEPESTRGLEAAVGVIQGARPHLTTLHRWLGGLGDRVLERMEKEKGERKKKKGPQRKPMPASAIVVETAKKLGLDLMDKWHEPVEIAAWKYESEQRRDQLEACARLLNAATFLFRQSPHPVSSWHAWVISEIDVAGWAFLSRGRCTTFLIDEKTGVRVACLRWKTHKRRESTHGTRSPPSGLLAVRADQSASG